LLTQQPVAASRRAPGRGTAITVGPEVRVAATSPAEAYDYISGLGLSENAYEWVLATRILCPAGPWPNIGADEPAGAADRPPARGLPGSGTAEVRLTQIPLPPIMILSSWCACLPGVQPAAHGTQTMTAWVHDASVASVLTDIFDGVWATAAPAGSATDPAGLTREEAVLLRCLADGLTYRAIARRFGVSPRTIERRVATLTARLDARGRFQALHEAARRGWL
jgi:DNA-binding CsgD family transcriptional regulator